MAEPAQAAGDTAEPTFTSRVVAPLQIALGVVVAAALLAVLAALGLWPLGLAGCLLLLAVTWYQAAVTLTIDAREVLVGQGRGKRGLRDILVRNIVLYEVTRFGWGDAFGSSPAPASNTYVVRAGAGLRLVLNDDETINISATDPEAAAAVLRAAGVRPAPRVTPAAEPVAPADPVEPLAPADPVEPVTPAEPAEPVRRPRPPSDRRD